MKKSYYINSLILIGFIFVINSDIFAEDDIVVIGGKPIRVDCCQPQHFPVFEIKFFEVSVDWLNFSDFENILGKEIIDFTQPITATINFGFGYFYKGFNGMFKFGFMNADNQSNKNRNTNIKFNRTMLELRFGYRIINTRKFFISPDLALKYYRFRLINWDEDGRILLEDYVSNRDLDIRFHQLAGYSGLSFAYKLPTPYYSMKNPLYVILSGGYNLKLNDKPWITSAGSKIATNNKLDVTYGFSLGFQYNIPYP